MKKRSVDDDGCGLYSPENSGRRNSGTCTHRRRVFYNAAPANGAGAGCGADRQRLLFGRDRRPHRRLRRRAGGGCAGKRADALLRHGPGRGAFAGGDPAAAHDPAPGGKPGGGKAGAGCNRARGGEAAAGTGCDAASSGVEGRSGAAGRGRPCGDRGRGPAGGADRAHRAAGAGEKAEGTGSGRNRTSAGKSKACTEPAGKR